MTYDIFEHRHRFSVWAAARAVQRGWNGATVSRLQDALESCKIKDFLLDEKSLKITKEEFDSIHKLWCKSFVDYLKEKNIETAYGRAAKCIAVYLKSMVIIGPYPECSLARVAHPPIDRILLNNLRKSNVNWTQLDEKGYYILINELRKNVSPDEPFWKLEEFWTPTEE